MTRDTSISEENHSRRKSMKRRKKKRKRKERKGEGNNLTAIFFLSLRYSFVLMDGPYTRGRGSRVYFPRVSRWPGDEKNHWRTEEEEDEEEEARRVLCRTKNEGRLTNKTEVTLFLLLLLPLLPPFDDELRRQSLLPSSANTLGFSKFRNPSSTMFDSI